MPSLSILVKDGPGHGSKQKRQSEIYFTIVTDTSQCEIGVILSPFYVKKEKNQSDFR